MTAPGVAHTAYNISQKPSSKVRSTVGIANCHSPPPITSRWAVSSVPPDQKSNSVHFRSKKVDTTSGSWRHVPDSALLPNGHVTLPSYGAFSSPRHPHFSHFSSSSLRLIGRTGQRHDFRPGRLPKPGQFVPFLSLPLCAQTRISAPSATLNPALVL